jgi:hypothetical protein
MRDRLALPPRKGSAAGLAAIGQLLVLALNWTARTGAGLERTIGQRSHREPVFLRGCKENVGERDPGRMRVVQEFDRYLRSIVKDKVVVEAEPL